MNSTAEHVGWVAEPTGRGTFGLLINCATTIFLSTYSAIHTNLPSPNDTTWSIQLRKMFYMLTCIVVPEYFAICAIQDKAYARELQRKNNIVIPNSKNTWKIKHYLFAAMGGFVVQTDSENRRVFHPNDIVRLIQEDAIEIPKIEENDIDDRSKANWVTKSIALIQVSWFLLQLLARAIQGLTVTTLELYTLSIVVCAVVIYAYYWHRPFDVQRPVVLQAKVTEYSWPQELEDQRIHSITITQKDLSSMDVCVMLGVFVAFSVCHVLGWNFVFASSEERLLWRIGSILCLVLPFTVLLLDTKLGHLCRRLGWPGFALYALARIALFVEMLTGLRSVPADVYQTPEWSDYLPSFGT